MNTNLKGIPRRPRPRLTEYKAGPEPGGIRFCCKCGGEIAERDLWLKEWAPDGEYAVGMHVTCALQDRPRVGACSLCGRTLRAGPFAALHFCLAHGLAYPRALLS